MRFIFLAALSLAVIAAVNGSPIGDSQPNVTTSVHSRMPTSSVVCCVTPQMPPHCTECHTHSVTPVHPSAPTHHRHNGTMSADPHAPTHHHKHHHYHHNGTNSIHHPVPTHHHLNGTLSTRAGVPSASDLAKNQPTLFLSTYVFQGLLVDEFKFESGPIGSISGPNKISRWITVPAGNTQLAIHLNCVVTPSGLQNNAMKLYVQHFHLTARSIATQRTIDAHAPSSLTAQRSIHIGVDQANGWSPAANVGNLQQEINVDPVPILQQHGYTTQYMRYLMNQFMPTVKQSIDRTLGANVEVQWTGDASFPVN